MGDRISVAAIVAMAENRAIGKDNTLLWHIPEDLKHFKTTTMGKPLVMGRKTFESILAFLGKPMAGRTTIVVSRSGYSYDGVEVFTDVKSAIEAAREIALRDGQDEVMVCGGGQIYEQALPFTDRIYLTTVHKDYDGDCSFPALNEKEWQKTTLADAPENDPPYTIEIWDRI